MKCEICKFTDATCLMPTGDGALDACWNCAHAIIIHGASVKAAPAYSCVCPIAERHPRSDIETIEERKRPHDEEH